MLNSSIGLFSIYHPFQLNYPFVMSLFLTRGLPVKMGSEKIEDAKVVIRSHKSKEDKKKVQTIQWPKEKGQSSTKHYTENLRSSNTNPTKS